tara:strand:+ start:1383 stop:2447 length:1065 start_codon:yes stop_codon:yes gene_type:complete
MKYLLPILCLFVFSCDSDDDTHGCLDSQACNYNPNASIDNNSCIYEEEGYDCDGNNLCGDDPIGWITGACGDCDSGIYDCEGICDGDAIEDECGVCNGDGTNCEFAANIILTNNSIPLSGANIFIKYLCGDMIAAEICAGNNLRPSQMISFEIPFDGLVIINEYDLDNNLIRNLLDGYMQAGSYDFSIPSQDGIAPFGASATKIKLEFNNEEIEEYSILFSAPDFYSADNLGETDANGEFFLSDDFLNSTSLPTFYNFNFTQIDEFGNTLGNYNINQLAPSMKIFFLYDNIYKMFDINLINANSSYSFEWNEGEEFNPRSINDNISNVNESRIERDNEEVPSNLKLNLYPNPYN